LYANHIYCNHETFLRGLAIPTPRQSLLQRPPGQRKCAGKCGGQRKGPRVSEKSKHLHTCCNTLRTPYVYIYYIYIYIIYNIYILYIYIIYTIYIYYTIYVRTYMHIYIHKCMYIRDRYATYLVKYMFCVYKDTTPSHPQDQAPRVGTRSGAVDPQIPLHNGSLSHVLHVANKMNSSEIHAVYCSGTK